jgi:hypothetical protein
MYLTRAIKTYSLIKWSPNEWPSFCRPLPERLPWRTEKLRGLLISLHNEHSVEVRILIHKVKLSQCYEEIWGSASIAPPCSPSALDGEEWSASRLCLFTPGERTSGTHRIGSWVGPRGGLSAVEKIKKILHCRDSNPDRPALSPSLYRIYIYIYMCVCVCVCVCPSQHLKSNEDLIYCYYYNNFYWFSHNYFIVYWHCFCLLAYFPKFERFRRGLWVHLALCVCVSCLTHESWNSGARRDGRYSVI